MVTRTLSPRAGTVAVLFLMLLLLLTVRQLQPECEFSNLLGSSVFLLCYMPASNVYLSSRTRRKRVEHRIPSQREPHDWTAADFPIRIDCEGRANRARHAVVPGNVVICCTIPGMMLSVAALLIPAPLAGWQFLAPLIGLALLLSSCVIAKNRKSSPICEITSQGIIAPDGIVLGAMVFVPWDAVVECELIHDNVNSMQTYFRLRDRAGRLQFKWSFGWLHVVEAADRNRIYDVLRSRFPLVVREGATGKPGAVAIASKELWDRDLDC